MLKYSELRGVFKLEGNQLGRPYHRLPNMFISKFDIIESRLGTYFLKKHRCNVNLKKISCQMDVKNKQADLLASPIGNLGFDIDRPLLLSILNSFYGLDGVLENTSKCADLATKTEIRLRNRLAVDICSSLFSDDILSLPLKIKADHSNICSQWSYQITFSFHDDPDSNFYILLDNAHTDYILNILRKKEKPQIDEPASSRQAKQKLIVKQIINTLPLSLNITVAELAMNVADLTTIKAGDIFPISLPEKFPVSIGQSGLFNALIIEDNDKLFLSEILENIAEKSL